MVADDARFDIAREFASGLERLRRVLGEQVAEELVAQRERAKVKGDSARVEVPVALTWGWLLDRPGLSPRDRAIAMIAVDVARGTQRALHDHLLFALEQGLTEAELRELMTQLGPYAGYPSVNEASATLRSVVAAQRSPAPPASSSWFDRKAAMSQCTLVVTDARRAAEELSALFAVPSWRVTTLKPGLVAMTIAGEIVDYEMVRAAGVTPAGTRFELLQPVTGPSALHMRLLVHGPYVDSLTVAHASDQKLDLLLRQASASDVPVARMMTAPDGARHVVLASRDMLGGYGLTVTTADLDRLDDALPVHEEWTYPTVVSFFGQQRLDHIGVVVRDLAARTAAHALVFGAPRWPVNRFSSADGTLTSTCFAGRPCPDTYLSSIARVGSFAVELCQPISGPSRYREGFLEPCGEGVQHLFFGPWSRPDEWDETVRTLTERGLELVTEGRAWDGGVRYGYLATREIFGFDLEIACIDPDLALDPRSRAAFVLEHDPAT